MLESFKKNRTGILLMICSSIFVCIGQLFWKLSVEQGLWYMLVGFCLYGIGALVMLVAYRYGGLSVLQPVLSLNYVITIFLGTMVLHETITTQKLVGIVVIIAGVVLIGGGDTE